jgi:uncharacterized glyoxalase superfamily protein PhnB
MTRDGEGRPVHAEVRAGDGIIYLHRVAPEFRVVSPCHARRGHGRVDLIVDDVEAHYEDARAEGAEIVYPPKDMPYGVREYGARDLEGGPWSFMAPLHG